jgi:hypothetical protein
LSTAKISWFTVIIAGFEITFLGWKSDTSTLQQEIRQFCHFSCKYNWNASEKLTSIRLPGTGNLGVFSKILQVFISIRLLTKPMNSQLSLQASESQPKIFYPPVHWRKELW